MRKSLNSRRWVVLGVALLMTGLFIALLSSCGPQQKKAALRRTCVDCHKEYAAQFRGGGVHEPVRENRCEACHRPHGLIGGVYLKKSEPELCFGCHASVRETFQGQPHLHEPVKKGECGACHDPHNSEFPALLQQAAAQACFVCHDQEPFARQYVHAPVEESCQACHQTHGSSQPYLLNEEKDQLCQSCHALSEKGFLEKHGNYPATTGCNDCHSVHSADHPALLKASVHAPVAELSCNDCHNDPAGADPFKLADFDGDRCYDCHADQHQRFDSEDAHPPVREGQCRSCHSPMPAMMPGYWPTKPRSSVSNATPSGLLARMPISGRAGGVIRWPRTAIV